MHANSGNRKAVEEINSFVGLKQEQLLSLYFTNVNSVLPILSESDTLQSFRACTIDPALLASIYLVSRRWLNTDDCRIQELEETALRHFNAALPKPQISTVQAGLLLIQSSSTTSHLMSTQLTSIGYDLGLQQDCSQWELSQSEKNLRKRLGWMLYAQDKWFSLLHGRPSYISLANWTVTALSEKDFDDIVVSNNSNTTTTGTASLIIQLTALTQILSSILEKFYTLNAEAEIKAAGSQGLRLVLEKAKPVQIQLKAWFTQLPESLKMDATTSTPTTPTTSATSPKPLARASLHLAYFAAEITLHRTIIRATALPTTDSTLPLSHICRSAAKTRLISSMDFVNRLRPSHLSAFWPFAGFANFALVGTFGALLEATSPSREEADFYHMRLEEYRWTLAVSRDNADSAANFLAYALESLDTNLRLLQHLPEKPSSADIGVGVGAIVAYTSQVEGHTDRDADMSTDEDGDNDDASDPIRGTGFNDPPSTFSGGLVSPAISLADSGSSSVSGGSSNGQDMYFASSQRL